MDIIAEESEMNTNGSEKRKEQVSHDQSCCISVIVPVYQAESYLPRCMESIRLQTWQTYEVMLEAHCVTAMHSRMRASGLYIRKTEDFRRHAMQESGRQMENGSHLWMQMMRWLQVIWKRCIRLR